MQRLTHLNLGPKLTGAISLISIVTLILILNSVMTLQEQESDSTVINIAGRQRMLSQKVSKEALAIHAGLSIEQNRAALRKTKDAFTSSLRDLKKGNTAKGLPPTESQAVLSQLDRVDTLWRDFSSRLDVTLNPNSSKADIALAAKYILNENAELLSEMNKAVGMYAEISQNKIGNLKTLLYGSGLIILIVTIMIAFYINRAIVKPLQRIVHMVNAMEAGNLDKRLNMRQKDEIGQLGNNMDRFASDLKNEILTAFRALAEGDFTFKAKGLIAGPLSQTNSKLSQLVQSVQHTSLKVSNDSFQVAATSTTLADGATRQASALEQISASMAQMNAQTTSNTQNAKQVNDLSTQAQKATEQGNTQMQAMVQAMQEINEAGQSISKIIKVIDEIAFQTNLLALNAAVEAARAGQHGKGFAVVAEEVRNLAARSAKAASETTELIQGSVERTENGARIADQTATALKDIYQSVVQVSDLVDAIANSSEEQATGIAQANEGLNLLDSVNQQTTASAEETASVAEELSAATGQLQRTLERFKIVQDQGSLVQRS